MIYCGFVWLTVFGVVWYGLALFDSMWFGATGIFNSPLGVFSHTDMFYIRPKP
jgi:hypothetical protein